MLCYASTVATMAAFSSRWSTLLAFSAARAFGASFLGLPVARTANVDGDQPLPSEVFSSTRFDATQPWTRAWRMLTLRKQHVAAVTPSCTGTTERQPQKRHKK